MPCCCGHADDPDVRLSNPGLGHGSVAIELNGERIEVCPGCKAHSPFYECAHDPSELSPCACFDRAIAVLDKIGKGGLECILGFTTLGARCKRHPGPLLNITAGVDQSPPRKVG